MPCGESLETIRGCGTARRSARSAGIPLGGRERGSSRRRRRIHRHACALDRHPYVGPRPGSHDRRPTPAIAKARRSRGSWLTALVAAALLLPGCLAFHAQPLPGPPEGATFLDIEETQVRYIDREASTGVELGTAVLVHGFGASTTEWLELMPALNAAGFRTVAMDLRGHGWSTRPDGDYSIEGQAALVLALLERLGVDRFAIVGHSWGSAVSLQVVLEARERVERIVLYNGMFFDDQQPVLFSWARLPGLGEAIYGGMYPQRQEDKLAFAFYDPAAHITEDMVELLHQSMDRPGTLAAALAGVRQMDYEPLEASYSSIEQPVLLLWGREDEVTPLEYGERLQNQLQDAQLVVIPQCGHLPMVEVPVRTNAEVVRFLEAGAGG